ncbi:MAG: hypothetical protein V4438_03455 [Patescibacteria group bacterium]
MSTPERIDTEQYLRKVQNTNLDIDPEVLNASLERLNKPFENIIRDENDNVEIKIGNSEIKIAYSPYVFGANETGTQNPIVSNSKKIISVLRVRTDKIDTDLVSLIPKESKIIEVDMNEFTGHTLSLNQSDVKDIAIYNRLESLHALVILLHEMGHIVDEEKLKKMGICDSIDEHPNSDLALLIRKERVASAFAIRTIRSIVKDKTQISDVVNLLKHGALRSYYVSVAEKIKHRSNGVSPADLDMNAQDITGYIDSINESEW